MKKILIIDDEPKLCKMLRRRLELRGGYEVATACSGAAGIEKATAAQFDLVLTDVVMPGMGGYTVVETLKTLRPQLPVVLLSVYHDDERIVTPDLLKRVDGVIGKPIDRDRFFKTIEDVLARHPSESQHPHQ